MGCCCSHPREQALEIGPVPDNHYEEAMVDPDIIVANSQLYSVEGHGIFANDETTFVMLPESQGGGDKNASLALARDEEDPYLHFVQNRQHS